jgi:hypothetical protein
MAYLASQLAIVPHAHGRSGEGQSSDHDARPHFHVSWFGHAEHDHHHDHVGGQSRPHSSEPDTDRGDHDSDAIYLPNDTGLSLPGQSFVAPDNLQVVSTLTVAAAPVPTANSNRVADAFFAGECSPGCPLYLALRALRI